MTLCVFVLIASEFMPVSLLTPIARDLGVTEGLAGQGIAISGALAVLTSLSLPALAGNVNRKFLLLGMTALMAVSGIIIALASNYLVYMAGRAMIGIAIGGFWSMSAATAIRLVPPHQVTRAPAIFNGGNALATVVAAPLGSYLGQFTLFTYVRPFLETVTRVDDAGLSLILLLTGVAGFIGTLIIPVFLNAKFYPALTAIPLLMAVTAMMLILTGHHVWVVALLLGFWGLPATAAPTGWWTWIARTLPDDAEAGGGLMVAVIQFAIALGSTAGGMVFDHFGWQSMFALSGLLFLCAGMLTFFTARRKAGVL